MKTIFSRLFSGRINQLTFFIGVVLTSTLYLSPYILSIIDFILNRDSFLTIPPIIRTILLIIYTVLILSLYIRRFHDIEKSGWFSLIGIIPLINFFAFFYLIIKTGTKGKNIYGNKPSEGVNFSSIFGLK